MSPQRVENYFLGNQNLNRHLWKPCSGTMRAFFWAFHVERQHLFLRESSNKVNPSWLENKYTLQFADEPRPQECGGHSNFKRAMCGVRDAFNAALKDISLCYNLSLQLICILVTFHAVQCIYFLRNWQVEQTWVFRLTQLWTQLNAAPICQ